MSKKTYPNPEAQKRAERIAKANQKAANYYGARYGAEFAAMVRRADYDN